LEDKSDKPGILAFCSWVFMKDRLVSVSESIAGIV